MGVNRANKRFLVAFDIIFWGACWGIIESTVGYLLHRVSFAHGWLIWYPFACFIMANVYRKTGRVSSIFFMGFLAALIKLLNLLLPGPIDRVINPAISIVLEALAMAVVIFAANRLFKEKKKNPFVKFLTALAMNTGWRLLFILYLLLLAPDWIREVSVINRAEEFVSFFITRNLITCAIISVGYIFKPTLLKPVEFLENHIFGLKGLIPKPKTPIFETGASAILICVNITLQFILR